MNTLSTASPPFGGAVGRALFAQQRRRGDVRLLRQPLAQAARQVGHLLELLRAALVDPAEQLHGTKRLLAEPLAVGGQCVAIEIEEVDHTESNN
jgi:hypothetical protein